MMVTILILVVNCNIIENHNYQTFLPNRSYKSLYVHRMGVPRTTLNTKTSKEYNSLIPLQLRHHEHDGVSNRRRLDCSLNRSSRRRSNKTAKLRTSLTKAGNAENVSIWWRRHSKQLDTPWVLDFFLKEK